MDNIGEIIKRVKKWQNAEEIKIEKIGGLTNTNYLVTVDGSPYVLRVSGQNTANLGIDRLCEYRALQNTSAAGISPEVVDFLLPEGHLVTRWVEGYHPSADEFRTVENVCKLTDMVKRIHSLPSNGASFSPFQKAQSYLDTLVRLQAQQPEGIDEKLNTMRLIKEDQKKDHTHWNKFCHNDLVSVNYLFTPSGIKVLDWEFSGMGDIYYDLATIVYTHDSDGPISIELEEEMLNHYFGNVNNEQRKRLCGMKFMLMFFTALWGFTQNAMVQAGMIPPADGFDYLEFANQVYREDLSTLESSVINFY